MRSGILLHICCAPCATSVVEELRARDFSVSGFFYNPSIHPWKELQRRLSALKDWAPTVDLPVKYHEEYPLEENMRMLLDADNRCSECFYQRLSATAREAGKTGIDIFTTTLSVSPYQNHDLLIEAGMRAAGEAGVEFMYMDFRNLYKRSIEISRAAGLYRQPYCGCVFSERDRYLGTKSPGSS